MSKIKLEDRFPGMHPIDSIPSLRMFNGFGTRLCGTRDVDSLTGWYITTRCVCALFIPIIALRAYRVTDAEDGQVFIGREPLSPLAKGWNMVMAAVVAGLCAALVWASYIDSPDYRAAGQLEDARRLAESDQPVEAAELYSAVIMGRTSHAGGAEYALKSLLDDLVRRGRAEQAASVLDIVINVQRRFPETDIIRQPFEWGAPWVERFAASDVRGALEFLDVIAPLAKDTAAVDATRVQLLERAVAEAPESPDLASRLALMYEARGELDKCDELLVPLVERLGASEGARILGQSYARRGEYQSSFALLLPYVDGRLQQFRAAEEAYNAVVEQKWARVVERLKGGEGSEDFYRRYEAADEAGQQAIVREYVETQIRDDPAIVAAQEEMMALADVVPVALDLGIVRLRRAQKMVDSQARRDELAEAEKTFLAIRGLAGGSDEYRLYLGQVYYWLGKHAEGRALFDEVLIANQRDFDTLMAVCSALRDVGAESDARQLAEEAYEKETDPARKYEAARMRALMPVDTDDTITWLERADPSDVNVMASLHTARGRKAIQEGEDATADRHFRNAIKAYASQSESASALNNAALVYFSLFLLNGDRAAFDEGVEMLEKAVALDPGDSILLFNSASTLIDAALMDIIGDAIDVKRLRMRGDLEMLPYLYKDPKGRESLRQVVAEHPSIAKALERFDKVMVLAPKNSRTYATVAELYEFTRDVEALTELRGRMREVELDLADEQRRALDIYAGKDDGTRRADIQASVARFQKLVEEMRSRPAHVEFAIAAGYLVRQQITGTIVGLEADPNELVALAEAAHKAAPSSATRRTLLHALLFRANQELVRQNTRYAEIVARAGRAVHPSSLIAVALHQGDDVQAAILENTDFQSALSLVIEDAHAFPDDARPWGWAMLKPSFPEEAAEVACAVAEDRVARVMREIDQALHPVSASVALEAYWCALIAGEEAAGLDILRNYAAKGVPMPFDVEGRSDGG
jgi:tetratricopeptide (TPR) repeat protein